MADLLCSLLAGQSLALKWVSQAEPTNQHSPPSWCHFENTECNSKKTPGTLFYHSIQATNYRQKAKLVSKRLIRCRSCCNNSGRVLWLAKQIPTHTLPEASLSLQTPTADTKQTTIAQLLCLNTTSLFSKTGQWTHTHIHTHSYCTHARTHTRGVKNPVLLWRLRFRQQVGQPLNPDVTSPLLFMNLFLSSAELSELKVPTPLHYFPPALSSSPTFTPCQQRRANTVWL